MCRNRKPQWSFCTSKAHLESEIQGLLPALAEDPDVFNSSVHQESELPDARAMDVSCCACSRFGEPSTVLIYMTGAIARNVHRTGPCALQSCPEMLVMASHVVLRGVNACESCEITQDFVPIPVAGAADFGVPGEGSLLAHETVSRRPILPNETYHLEFCNKHSFNRMKCLSHFAVCCRTLHVTSSECTSSKPARQ